MTEEEDKAYSLPSLNGERERKTSIIYTKKRTIYTAGTRLCARVFVDLFVLIVVTQIGNGIAITQVQIRLEFAAVKGLVDGFEKWSGDPACSIVVQTCGSCMHKE